MLQSVSNTLIHSNYWIVSRSYPEYRQSAPFTTVVPKALKQIPNYVFASHKYLDL